MRLPRWCQAASAAKPTPPSSPSEASSEEPAPPEAIQAAENEDMTEDVRSGVDCFPADLNVTARFDPAYREALTELQLLSPPRRMTTSRHGRELQRWAPLDSTSAQRCKWTTGCIPLFPGGRVLLISSRKARHLWVLPKGGWELDETLAASALRETMEEAGVTGRLGPPLPARTYETRKARRRRLEPRDENAANEPQHTHNRLVLFPMYVQCVYDDWPERDARARCIVTIERALQLLGPQRPEFAALLQELCQRQWHEIV